jgi:hypothetical protein
MGETFIVQQVSFGAFATGISDHAGGTTREADRAMAGKLKSPESQQPNEVSDMETVCRWVKAAVKDNRSFIELSGQGVAVSCVMDEPAGLEIRKNVHTDSVPRHEVKGEELL